MTVSTDPFAPLVALLKRFALADAKQWLTLWHTTHPDDPLALAHHAHLHLLARKPDLAAQALAQAEQLNPQSPVVLRNRARYALLCGDVAAAQAAAEQALALTPDDPDNQRVYAAALGATEPQTALARLAALLAAHPDDAEALGQMAWLHYQGGRSDEAARLADQALALNPHLPRVWVLRASLYQQAGALGNACSAFARAQALEPWHTPWAVHHGDLQRQLQHTQAAIDILHAAVTQDPRDATAWAAYGLALHQAQRLGESRSAYQQALLLKPDQPAVLHNRLALVQDSGDWAGELADLEAVAKHHPDLVQIQIHRVQILIGLERFEEAVSATRALRHQHPEQLEVLLLLVHLLLGQEQLTQAGTALLAAEATHHEAQPYQLARADYHRRKGHFADAEHWALRALKTPSDWLALSQLAALWIEQGRLEDLEAKVRHAVAHAPEAVEGQEMLAQVLSLRHEAEAACALFAGFIDARPTLSNLINYGVSLQSLGELDASLAQYHRALRLFIATEGRGIVPNLHAPMPVEAAHQTLARFQEVMAQLRIPFFVIAGTLLGIVRDGRLLPKDKDMDVALPWATPRLALLDTLVLYDFRCLTEKKFRATCEAGHEAWNVPFVDRLTGVVLDVFFAKRQEDTIELGIDHQPEALRWQLPRFGLKPLQYAGLSLLAPDPPESFLDAFYGSDWRVSQHYDCVLRGHARLPDTPNTQATRLCYGYNRLLDLLQRGYWSKAVAYCRQMQGVTQDPLIDQALELAKQRQQALDALPPSLEHSS